MGYLCSIRDACIRKRWGQSLLSELQNGILFPCCVEIFEVVMIVNIFTQEDTTPFFESNVRSPLLPHRPNLTGVIVVNKAKPKETKPKCPRLFRMLCFPLACNSLIPKCTLQPCHCFITHFIRIPNFLPSLDILKIFWF